MVIAFNVLSEIFTCKAKSVILAQHVNRLLFCIDLCTRLHKSMLDTLAPLGGILQSIIWRRGDLHLKHSPDKTSVKLEDNTLLQIQSRKLYLVQNIFWGLGKKTDSQLYFGHFQCN